MTEKAWQLASSSLSPRMICLIVSCQYHSTPAAYSFMYHLATQFRRDIVSPHRNNKKKQKETVPSGGFRSVQTIYAEEFVLRNITLKLEALRSQCQGEQCHGNKGTAYWYLAK